MALDAAKADAVAEAVGLDVDDLPICLACLSLVSFAIAEGNERKIAAAIRSIAPDLWDEGLAQPLRLALDGARDRGIVDTAEAIDSVRALGPRSPVTRAVIRRLGSDLWARSRGNIFRMGFEPWPPRELS